MNRRRLLIGGGITGAALAMPSLARAAVVSHPHPRLARLVERWIAERRIAGAVLAIGRHNRGGKAMAWGYSALAGGQFLNEDSIFRIYSMTKPVTAAAAMILIGERRLKLDQPVADIIPAFARIRVATDPAVDLSSRPAQRPITIRHLLTHTAGFAYANGSATNAVERAYHDLGLVPGLRNLADERPRAPSLADFAERLASVPLLFEPGARWHYSLSLDLLGAVIERVEGRPFDAFLKDRIREPLDMDDTGFQVMRRSLPRLVTNYLATPAGLQPFDVPPETVYARKPPFPFGGSGLVSTARDYSRFAAMLLGEGVFGGNEVMKPEMARLMMSNLLPEGVIGPNGQGFGAGGFVITQPPHTGQGLGTYGWAGLGGTMMWVDPHYRVHATYMAQYMPIDALPAQYAVPRAVYEDLSGTA